MSVPRFAMWSFENKLIKKYSEEYKYSDLKLNFDTGCFLTTESQHHKKKQDPIKSADVL